MSRKKNLKAASLNRRVVLITGASTGLGLAITRQLLDLPQYHVIATARSSSLSRFSQLGLTENSRLWIRPLDVLSKADRDHVIAEANEVLGGIDILINNAGYCLRAVVEHVNETERLMQVDTNFRAPLSLIRGVLPKMREKRYGRIINVSSVGGMMAMPTMAIYSASKFALEGASEALWYEVRPWNIKVTLIEPGFVHSDAFKRVKLTKESEKSFTDKKDPYHHHYASMSPFIERFMNLSPTTPDHVARKIVKVLKKKNPPLRVPVTWDAYLFGIMRRLLPQFIYLKILYFMLPHIREWGDTDEQK